MLITHKGELDDTLYAIAEGYVSSKPSGYFIEETGYQRTNFNLTVEIADFGLASRYGIEKGLKAIVACSYFLKGNAGDNKQAMAKLIESLEIYERVVAFGKFTPLTHPKDNINGTLTISSIITPTRLAKLCLTNLEWKNNAEYTGIHQSPQERAKQLTQQTKQKKPRKPRTKKQTDNTDDYYFD